MKTANEIEFLREKLEIKVGVNSNFSTRVRGRRLELNLNTGEGFYGCEQVFVTRKNDLYDVAYFGIFSQAFRTFLNERFTNRIQESEMLSKLREKIARVRDKKKIEVYDEKRKQIYLQIANLTERGYSYEETEKAVLFFSDVFKEKTKGHIYNASTSL